VVTIYNAALSGATPQLPAALPEVYYRNHGDMVHSMLQNLYASARNKIKGPAGKLPSVLVVFFPLSMPQNPALELPQHVFCLNVKSPNRERFRLERRARAQLLRFVFPVDIPVAPGKKMDPPLGNCAETVAIVVAQEWTGKVGFVALQLRQNNELEAETATTTIKAKKKNSVQEKKKKSRKAHNHDIEPCGNCGFLLSPDPF
jgi:hypothetical protein